MDDELEQDRLERDRLPELASDEEWRAEWLPEFDGSLSPEELQYLAYIEDYQAALKPRAEWELRDYTIERMEDFLGFLRNRAN